MGNKLKITVCPSCGSRKIKKTKHKWTGKFRGQTYRIPTLEIYECANCGEKVYDREAMRKIEAYSPAFCHTHIEKKSA